MSVGLSDENPTQQCAPIGRGGDAHVFTEPQSCGNSSNCNLQRHDADNLNGSPVGSAAASESGVEHLEYSKYTLVPSRIPSTCIFYTK